MNADACDAYIAVVFYSVDCFNDLIQFYYVIAEFFMNSSYICLLYTSDAADEL